MTVSTAVAACIVAVAVVLLGVVGTPPALAQAPQTTQPTQTLEQQKLREEIRQLKLQNRDSGGFRGFFSSYFGSVPALAGFLTALVAAGGLVFTIRQQTREQTRQKQQDREQHVKDREQRELESRRLLDERFAGILSDLGASSEAVQAGAAISLLSFLEPENTQYHRQTRLAALVNLKVHHPAPIGQILVEVLATAMRTADVLDAFERDLSRAQLARIDLSGLDLSDADLAYANLRGANLNDTSLRRARGIEVKLEKARLSGSADLEAARLQKADCTGALFHDARLVAVHFEGATLVGAEFQGASLQAAHLEGADLRGAQFQRAVLNDTYFYNRKTGETAILDDTALRSITRAYDWQSAHYAPQDEERLRDLAAAKK